MDAQIKDRLELNLADYFPTELSDAVFAELMDRAVTAAYADFTVDVDNVGDLLDCTDYAQIVADVLADYADEKADRGDYLRDLRDGF
jgi:hypothetical protein